MTHMAKIHYKTFMNINGDTSYLCTYSLEAMEGRMTTEKKKVTCLHCLSKLAQGKRNR
jgi:hypothetical protein